MFRISGQARAELEESIVRASTTVRVLGEDVLEARTRELWLFEISVEHRADFARLSSSSLDIDTPFSISIFLFFLHRYNVS